MKIPKAISTRRLGVDSWLLIPGPRRTLVAVLAVTLGVLPACSPFVYQADFQKRSDDAEAADLLGPFTGRVVDAGTDKPVPGALVYASWEFIRGVGFLAPAGAVTEVLKTDRDGRYVLPRLVRLPSGATTAVARFRLIVYLRGYVVYRSDRVFPGDERRYDFVQQDNGVRLERWNPELSHVDHLRFAGGGPEVAQAMAWEIQAAAAVLEGRPVGSGPGTPDRPGWLDASALLDASDLDEAAGKRTTFAVGRLTDLPRTVRYDSRHFKAVSPGERGDLAYRVWRLGDQADRHYGRLRAAYPAARQTDEVGDGSFRSATPDIGAVVFLVRQAGVVVSLTCGRDLCPGDDAVVKLARRIAGRLDRLRVVKDEPRLQPRRPGADMVNPFEPPQPRDPVLK